jgi:prepilin-type N-terminal cleavage/methylation domain-containing protein
MSDFCQRNPGKVPSKRQSGFTLLELIIVCVLIGMLLVVSVPTMRNNLLDDPIRSAGRKVIGYVSGVREKAVREQQPYLLYFDLDENRLWSLPESDEKNGIKEAPDEGVLQMPEDVDLRDLWSKTIGTTSRGIPELWISRQGYLDQSIIHIEDEDGEALSLLVLPFIPVIELHEGYYEAE